MGIWGRRSGVLDESSPKGWLERQLQLITAGTIAFGQMGSNLPREGVAYGSAEEVAREWGPTLVACELLAGRAGAVRVATQYAADRRLIRGRLRQDLDTWTLMARMEWVTFRRDFALRMRDPSGQPFNWESPERFRIIPSAEHDLDLYWAQHRDKFASGSPTPVHLFGEVMEALYVATGIRVPLERSPQEYLASL